MKIRFADEGDAEAIARVYVESWRSSYRDIISADHLASLSVERRAERWRELLKNQESKTLTFFAESTDGQIIKFYETLGGQYVTEKVISIGDQELTEVAYGWLDIEPLLET